MKQLYLGIDIGSISVKAVLLDENRDVTKTVYRRMYGKPLPILAEILAELHAEFSADEIKKCGVSGTGGELVAGIVGGEFVNEIVAQSHAIGHLCPDVTTVIEMGGQDSKFIQMKKGDNGKSVLEDFAMNTVCAAGTGSFLDQQATRLNVPIEREFGNLALKSAKPPRVAGRCSVFAKSDMIHLQQIGTPDYDIVAGLCFAVARSFKANIARGKNFTRPIAFIGGVASNIGVVKAFEKELELDEGELVIPEHHAVTGAIGAALTVMESDVATAYLGVAPLKDYNNAKKAITGGLNPLDDNDNQKERDVSISSLPVGTPVYIGIDIGSLSTNVVAVNDDGAVVARRYLRTSGRPIEAVTRGLREIGEEVGDRVVVKGVGTTGSGRYMIGDFVGADIVRNEITAQATAAVHFIPDVDTIFEIGGQDSKYISIKDGAVVDFEMNKVCAAGTGSFIEEQAERLNLDIKEDFSDAAFESERPGKFGERCTVFIETDLISHQQKGAPTRDLAAGLAYSIVRNYLGVVGDRQIGDKVLFQGGVAWNKAVVSAFANVTGKKIHIPPHHDVTGAIGTALIAMRHMRTHAEKETLFKGFELKDRTYKVTSFECKACENVCNVSRVKFGKESAHYYGARCELFEKDKKKGYDHVPDLFAERERQFFGDHHTKKKPLHKGKKKVVGIPRVLTMYEHFPFWRTLLEELGCEVVLSSKTNQEIIHSSVEHVKAETCFPVKVIHGHVDDLIEKGIDVLFLPSVITMNPKDTKFHNSSTCVLVQAKPYLVRSAIDLEKMNIEVWEPTVLFQHGDEKVAKEMYAIGKKLGVSKKQVVAAVRKARRVQDDAYASIRRRGHEIISGLDETSKAVVLISRPYNGCDSGINMDLPRKLREMGVTVIPNDYLPLDEEVVYRDNPSMFWRSGQKMQAAAEIVRTNPYLNAIYLSNFKCGPDSFISYHIQQQMRGKPFLHLEVDEHSADAGAITRCEAFFDSLENVDNNVYVDRKKETFNRGNGHRRTLYIPNMCDHALPLAEALNYYGQPSEVLPKTDEQSLDIGRKYSTGKECIPYTLTSGDILKKIFSKDFQPEKSNFFMPATDGPCRFGQYNAALRMVMDKLGYPNVDIMTTDAEGAYEGFEEVSQNFRRLAGRGIVAVDILQKLLQETRPYEKVPGSADSAYQMALEVLVKSVKSGGKDIFKRMYDIRDIFRAVPIDRVERRPIIAIVGEIYVRMNSFSNHNVIRQLEELGAEVWLAPFGEWIFYCIDRFIAKKKRDKKFGSMIAGKLLHGIQKRDEKKLLAPFERDLLNWHEPPTREVLEHAKPYLNETFEGEAILSIGKAIDYITKGCVGVVNLLPFTCMPGTVVTAISKKVRDGQNNIPWLNIDLDGTNESNGRSRLEAFVFQAKQRHNKTAKQYSVV